MVIGMVDNRYSMYCDRQGSRVRFATRLPGKQELLSQSDHEFPSNQPIRQVHLRLGRNLAEQTSSRTLSRTLSIGLRFCFSVALCDPSSVIGRKLPYELAVEFVF